MPQLVQHIRDNAYQVPPVDPDGIDAANAVVTGQVQGAALPAYLPRVISEVEQRALDHLRARLEHHGVAPSEYGIVEPRRDVLVLEPAPGPDGWQVQFWDASRGPTGRPRVYQHAVDAAKALLAELLWRDDADEARETRRASERGPATHLVTEPAVESAALPVAEVQPLPGEPPLSLLRDRVAVLLPVGTVIDRLGGPEGNLTFASGTPFAHRSLPPDWQHRSHHVYRVLRPVPAVTGLAVPWFEQPGGGTGYVLARAIHDLLADGSLVEVVDAASTPEA